MGCSLLGSLVLGEVGRWSELMALPLRLQWGGQVDVARTHQLCGFGQSKSLPPTSVSSSATQHANSACSGVWWADLTWTRGSQQGELSE